MTRPEHILTTLAEEGGEVAKECHKALRFGINDKVTLDPDGPRGTEGPTNAEKIEAEMIDMLGVYQMAVTEGLVADLGFLELPKAVVEGMMAKRARVERYMGYACRVGALSHIPKLNELACFRGQPEAPLRMLVEGPGGYTHIAGNTTIAGLIESLKRSGESVFPPSFTEETLPKVPWPALLIHPDYSEDKPPVVTAFGNLPWLDGQVRIQWDDGTQDWANVEDLRPVFWSSLDQPVSPPPFGKETVTGTLTPYFVAPELIPMPTEGLEAVQRGIDDKEKAIATLGIPGLGRDPRVGHPHDDKRTRELGYPAIWRFNLDDMHRPTWELWIAEDHGEGAWEPMHVIGRITQYPALEPTTLEVGNFWSADPLQGEAAVKRFADATGEDRARAHVIESLKAVESKGERIPTGPITVIDMDEVLVEPVNGLRCLWRRRFDGLDCEVWDLLVISDGGQEWTEQDPILGRVTESAFGETWTAESFAHDGWKAGYPDRQQAKEAVVDNLETSPL